MRRSAGPSRRHDPPENRRGIVRRGVDGTAQRPAGGPADPADGAVAPPMYGGDLAGVRVDGRERFGRTDPARVEPEDLEQRHPRHQPHRVTPAEPSPRIEEECLVDGAIAMESQAHPHVHPDTAAAPGAGAPVGRDQRVAQVPLAHGDRMRAAHGRPPPFELVDGEVHAVREQRLQGVLHAPLPGQLLEVPVLAAGQAEQRAIGALRALVHSVLHQREEIALAMGQAIPQNRAGLRHRDRMAEEAAEPAEEVRARPDVVERDHDLETPGPRSVGTPRRSGAATLLDGGESVIARGRDEEDIERSSCRSGSRIGPPACSRLRKTVKLSLTFLPEAPVG
jgi:hypothetical protein